jgi:hypothetical protein
MGELPRNAKCSGCACFSKIRCKPKDLETLEETFRMDGVEAPPFPVAGEAYAMLVAEGYTLEDAERSFREKRRQLADLVVCD